MLSGLSPSSQAFDLAHQPPQLLATDSSAASCAVCLRCTQSHPSLLFPDSFYSRLSRLCLPSTPSLLRSLVHESPSSSRLSLYQPVPVPLVPSLSPPSK